MNRNSSPPRRSSSSIPPPPGSERTLPPGSLQAPRVPRLSSSPPPRNSSAPPPAARPSSIPPSRDAPTPSTLLKYTLTPGEVKILRHFHEQLQMFEDKGAIMANMLSVLMALDRGIGELEHFTELTANRVLLETMRASAPGQGAAGGQA